MAHEIETHDRVVLHKEQAWHGLGVVVADAKTPQEMLELAGLDYPIVQRPVYCEGLDGEKILIDTHVANYREDINMMMGMVSANYVPVQNDEMADFCDALVDQADKQVRVDTAGSIRNGRRVWFLLKGEEFAVAKGDGIYPYVLVSNGHDGQAQFRVTPTTVRVVCSNTLHMVIPRAESGTLSQAAFAVKHTKNIMDRIEEAKLALKYYHERLEENRQLMETMAKRNVTHEDVQQFFWDCYNTEFGQVPLNPQNKIEENQKDRAMSAYQSFTKRFDDEREIARASVWNAFNAFSGMVQHDRKARGKDDVLRVERRVDSNLFGLNQARTQNALKRAYQMVV